MALLRLAACRIADVPVASATAAELGKSAGKDEAAGKRPMSGQEFLRGARLTPGDRLATEGS